MQPLKTIRTWQLEQLAKAVKTIEHIVANCSPEVARTARDGGDGWTVLEVMGHLRDFEAVFIERARLTLEQEMPDLPFPDPLQLVVEKVYNEDDLPESFNTWAAARRENLALLEAVAEEDWERPANHPTRGPFTLTDQLFLTVWHDMNHIEQMAKILGGSA
jgi:uncharacterized damage-inducible protein DinB